MAPRIGVTACEHPRDYLEAIRRAGGDPQVIEPGTGPAWRLLDRLGGLMLTGDCDVDPQLFGEQPHHTTRRADPGRNEFEIALMREAITHDLPVLAICRGLQVMNVALGGTLVQDIPSMITGAESHDVGNSHVTLAHEVWVTRGSALWHALEERLTDDTCKVNSRHHQAVAKVGDGLEVSATSPDGIIEGLERSASRFCVGVQWHPENFWRTGEFRSLFEAFVAACESA
jgi:putative glutamine amidotransferase